MQRILVIQTAFIGDVILATAVLEKLYQYYPEAQLDVLLRKGNEGLLKDHPFVHKLLIWKKKEGKYRELWKLLGVIRARQYDLVVNLQRFFSTGFLTAFSGAKHKVGFNKNPLAFTFTHTKPHRFGTEAAPIHEVDRILGLVSPWTDEQRVLPRLYPPLRLEKMKPEPPYICLAPTSVWFTKQWPLEKWNVLVDRLPGDHTIYLLGGPSDWEVCQQLQTTSKHPRVKNLAGQLSLLESAALIRDAAMNYVNDSAPLHLATATNAPVRAIFCSTVPRFGFYPLSQGGSVVETQEALSCRPCGLHGKSACPEGHFRCADIPIEQVFVEPLKR